MDVFFEWLQTKIGDELSDITLFGIFGMLVYLAKLFYKYFEKCKNEKDLFPFYDNSILKNSRKFFIRTKCQNIDPANEINFRSSYAFVTKEDMLNFFIKKVFKLKENETNFYIVLGDSGMGKTTFMLNLFYSYNTYLNSIFKKTRIKLLPLGENLDSIELHLNNISLEDRKNTILLLDGLDESPILNFSANELVEKLTTIAKDFRIVIISCRTHFFSSENDEPYELKIRKFNTNGNGYQVIKKLYVSPFDEKDIKKYLNKKFGILSFSKIREAKEIINYTDDLMVRPMLLSYIEDVMKSSKKVKLSCEIYELLIIKWIERESNKYQTSNKFDFQNDLFYFSIHVANTIYENFEKNGLFISNEEMKRLAIEFNINLDLLEMKSRSLLNRDSKGNYKFSHKSIFEYLLAYNCYRNRFVDKSQVYHIDYDLSLFDQALKFYDEMQINFKSSFHFNDERFISFHSGNNVMSNLKFEELMQLKHSKTEVEWLDGKTYRIIDVQEEILTKKSKFFPFTEKV
ncbi:NACHT domain-containing protein [Flavobacterium chungangensis]|uniref:NACHT domain-containing protein n=1 Tax=Flavobacterium chungangensis TaxID=2708132 RepID=A0ABV8ZAG2_9FLAO